MATGSRFVNPFAFAYTPTFGPIPGALLTFYLTGSSTEAITYEDAGLTTPNPNPVIADATGTFPNIFLDPAVTYKAVLQYPPNGTIPGAVIYTADPAETVPENSQEVPEILTGNTGAAQIGTETGLNVEQRLGALDSEASASGTAVTALLAGIPLTGFSGLKIASQGVANHTSIITATWALLTSSTAGDAPFLATAVNVSPVITAAGANGLDTGAVAASTWYYVYLIYDPTTLTVAGLFSLSPTSPTLPAGYTYAARVGAVRTDGTTNLLQTIQYGNTARYVPLAGSNLTALPTAVTGVQGSTTVPTWDAVAVAPYVPPTASAIRVRPYVFAGMGTGTIMVAETNAYAANGAGSPPLLMNCNWNNNENYWSQDVDLTLVSANVYYASSSASSGMGVAGWTDNL